MVELSISTEGLFGLTWSAWKRLVRAVEDLGFAGLYLSDHFVLPEPPDQPSLEMVVALTYLADHTERVRFGPMVSPLSFREPVLLARQAAALDDLSDGRMVLGLGAGWMEREHAMFGYDLGDVAMRFARFEDGLEVITRLLRSDDPVDYEGRFFRLREAVLPAPRRPDRPPVMIGGKGPRRTLPLVARFANVWNAQLLDPDQLRARSIALDELVRAAGRHPRDVRRTFTTPVICGRTSAELEKRLQGGRRRSRWADLPLDQLLDNLRGWPAIIGTPEEVVDQIRAYEAAGVVEVIAQWPGVDDIEGLEVLAAEVLPRLALATA